MLEFQLDKNSVYLYFLMIFSIFWKYSSL